MGRPPFMAHAGVGRRFVEGRLAARSVEWEWPADESGWSPATAGRVLVDVEAELGGHVAACMSWPDPGRVLEFFELDLEARALRAFQRPPTRRAA